MMTTNSNIVALQSPIVVMDCVSIPLNDNDMSCEFSELPPYQHICTSTRPTLGYFRCCYTCEGINVCMTCVEVCHRDHNLSAVILSGGRRRSLDSFVCACAQVTNRCYCEAQYVPDLNLVRSQSVNHGVPLYVHGQRLLSEVIGTDNLRKRLCSYFSYDVSFSACNTRRRIEWLPRVSRGAGAHATTCSSASPPNRHSLANMLFSSYIESGDDDSNMSTMVNSHFWTSLERLLLGDKFEPLSVDVGVSVVEDCHYARIIEVCRKKPSYAHLLLRLWLCQGTIEHVWDAVCYLLSPLPKPLVGVSDFVRLWCRRMDSVSHHVGLGYGVCGRWSTTVPTRARQVKSSLHVPHASTTRTCTSPLGRFLFVLTHDRGLMKVATTANGHCGRMYAQNPQLSLHAGGYIFCMPTGSSSTLCDGERSYVVCVRSHFLPNNILLQIDPVTLSVIPERVHLDSSKCSGCSREVARGWCLQLDMGSSSQTSATSTITKQCMPCHRRRRSRPPAIPPIQLKLGDFVDAVDNVGNWCIAKVVRVEESRFLLRFNGWGPRWDIWRDRYSQTHMQPLGTHTDQQAEVFHGDGELFPEFLHEEPSAAAAAPPQQPEQQDHNWLDLPMPSTSLAIMSEFVCSNWVYGDMIHVTLQPEFVETLHLMNQRFKVASPWLRQRKSIGGKPAKQEMRCVLAFEEDGLKLRIPNLNRSGLCMEDFLARGNGDNTLDTCVWECGVRVQVSEEAEPLLPVFCAPVTVHESTPSIVSLCTHAATGNVVHLECFDLPARSSPRSFSVVTRQSAPVVRGASRLVSFSRRDATSSEMISIPPLQEDRWDSGRLADTDENVSLDDTSESDYRGGGGGSGGGAYHSMSRMEPLTVETATARDIINEQMSPRSPYDGYVSSERSMSPSEAIGVRHNDEDSDDGQQKHPRVFRRFREFFAWSCEQRFSAPLNVVWDQYHGRTRATNVSSLEHKCDGCGLVYEFVDDARSKISSSLPLYRCLQGCHGAGGEQSPLVLCQVCHLDGITESRPGVSKHKFHEHCRTHQMEVMRSSQVSEAPLVICGVDVVCAYTCPVTVPCDFVCAPECTVAEALQLRVVCGTDVEHTWLVHNLYVCRNSINSDRVDMDERTTIANSMSCSWCCNVTNGVVWSCDSSVATIAQHPVYRCGFRTFFKSKVPRSWSTSSASSTPSSPSKNTLSTISNFLFKSSSGDANSNDSISRVDLSPHELCLMLVRYCGSGSSHSVAKSVTNALVAVLSLLARSDASGVNVELLIAIYSDIAAHWSQCMSVRGSDSDFGGQCEKVVKYMDRIFSLQTDEKCWSHLCACIAKFVACNFELLFPRWHQRLRYVLGCVTGDNDEKSQTSYRMHVLKALSVHYAECTSMMGVCVNGRESYVCVVGSVDESGDMLRCACEDGDRTQGETVNLCALYGQDMPYCALLSPHCVILLCELLTTMLSYECRCVSELLLESDDDPLLFLAQHMRITDAFASSALHFVVHCMSRMFAACLAPSSDSNDEVRSAFADICIRVFQQNVTLIRTILRHMKIPDTDTPSGSSGEMSGSVGATGATGARVKGRKAKVKLYRRNRDKTRRRERMYYNVSKLVNRAGESILCASGHMVLLWWCVHWLHQLQLRFSNSELDVCCNRLVLVCVELIGELHRISTAGTNPTVMNESADTPTLIERVLNEKTLITYSRGCLPCFLPHALLLFEAVFYEFSRWYRQPPKLWTVRCMSRRELSTLFALMGEQDVTHSVAQVLSNFSQSSALEQKVLLLSDFLEFIRGECLHTTTKVLGWLRTLRCSYNFDTCFTSTPQHPIVLSSGLDGCVFYTDQHFSPFCTDVVTPVSFQYWSVAGLFPHVCVRESIERLSVLSTMLSDGRPSVASLSSEPWVCSVVDRVSSPLSVEEETCLSQFAAGDTALPMVALFRRCMDELGGKCIDDNSGNGDDVARANERKKCEIAFAAVLVKYGRFANILCSTEWQSFLDRRVEHKCILAPDVPQWWKNLVTVTHNAIRKPLLERDDGSLNAMWSTRCFILLNEFSVSSSGVDRDESRMPLWCVSLVTEQNDRIDLMRAYVFSARLRTQLMKCVAKYVNNPGVFDCLSICARSIMLRTPKLTEIDSDAQTIFLQNIGCALHALLSVSWLDDCVDFQWNHYPWTRIQRIVAWLSLKWSPTSVLSSSVLPLLLSTMCDLLSVARYHENWIDRLRRSRLQVERDLVSFQQQNYVHSSEIGDHACHPREQKLKRRLRRHVVGESESLAELRLVWQCHGRIWNSFWFLFDVVSSSVNDIVLLVVDILRLMVRLVDTIPFEKRTWDTIHEVMEFVSTRSLHWPAAVEVELIKWIHASLPCVAVSIPSALCSLLLDYLGRHFIEFQMVNDVPPGVSCSPCASWAFHQWHASFVACERVCALLVTLWRCIVVRWPSATSVVRTHVLSMPAVLLDIYQYSVDGMSHQVLPMDTLRVCLAQMSFLQTRNEWKWMCGVDKCVSFARMTQHSVDDVHDGGYEDVNDGVDSDNDEGDELFDRESTGEVQSQIGVLPSAPEHKSQSDQIRDEFGMDDDYCVDVESDKSIGLQHRVGRLLASLAIIGLEYDVCVGARVEFCRGCATIEGEVLDIDFVCETVTIQVGNDDASRMCVPLCEVRVVHSEPPPSVIDWEGGIDCIHTICAIVVEHCKCEDNDCDENSDNSANVVDVVLSSVHLACMNALRAQLTTPSAVDLVEQLPRRLLNHLVGMCDVSGGHVLNLSNCDDNWKSMRQLCD